MSEDASIKYLTTKPDSSLSDSLTESEGLLSEHIVLLNSDEAQKKNIGVDLFGAVGYTAEHSQLVGHEEAFNNIQIAQERAAYFLQEKKEEISLMLNEDKEPWLFGSCLEDRSNSCGPFHHFVDGVPMCQVHNPCWCLVCCKSDADVQTYTSNEIKHEPDQQKDSLMIKTEGLQDSGNRIQTNADTLFEHFFQVHKKLPFDVVTMPENNISGLLGDESEDKNRNDDLINVESEQAMVNALPHEIILKIFSYLNHDELAHKAALVCKKWKEFAYDPIHWTSLHIERAMSSYDFVCLLKRVPLLKELYLCGQCVDYEEILFVVQSCPQLQILDLGFVTTLLDTFISAIAENCENLEYLNVEGCSEFSPACIHMLCQEGRVPQLKGLNVSHCTKLTDESIIHLANSKKQLEMLNIDGISWLTDITLISISQCRGGTLKYLYVDGADLSIRTVQAIATNCTNIEVLSWSFAELLLDSALLYIKQMGRLRELTLKKGIELTNEGAQILFGGESQLDKLKKLDLSEWTNMGDEGIFALCNCCGPQLTHLSLCWCWNITDVGLEYIIDKCINMIDLDLLGIDKIKGQCMVDIPVKMPRLKRLHLRQCNKINDDLIVEIIKKMPGLKAYNYYGDEFEVQRTPP